MASGLYVISFDAVYGSRILSQLLFTPANNYTHFVSMLAAVWLQCYILVYICRLLNHCCGGIVLYSGNIVLRYIHNSVVLHIMQVCMDCVGL